MAKRRSETIDFARRLRREATDAERRVWQSIRNRQIEGRKFRRQVPIGPYVADFLCAEARLVIELDGGQHADRAAYDERRTAWLREQGYRVIRFWNVDVMTNFHGILDRIRLELRGEWRED
jgi:very-short-patch-repair endonuclease